MMEKWSEGACRWNFIEYCFASWKEEVVFLSNGMGRIDA